MPISIQIIVRIVEISSDLPKLVITIHGYFLLPVICGRKINILEKIMTEDEKMALATFKFGIISAHIPAKKRFVFLITADRIQPIENFDECSA